MEKDIKLPILVVDDNEISRLVTTETLLSHGIPAESAESGMEAIKMYEENSYSLVLMDQEMPELNGVESMRRLRRIETNTPAPIVLLTANTEESVKDVISEFDGYIKKPIDLSAIDQLLQKFNLTKNFDIGHSLDNVSEEDELWFEHYSNIAGIDSEAALSHTGSIQLMRKVVECFALEVNPELDVLRSHLNSSDIEGIRISMHTLKHSAYLIGALDLSAQAEAAEKAAQALDTDKINQLSNPIIEAFIILSQDMDKITEKFTHKPSNGDIDSKHFHQGLEDMHQLIEAFDYENCLLICDMLKDYNLTEEQHNFIHKMEEALWRADQHELLQLIGEGQNND
ncbi:MAG: response regulator [Lachnospiraceae bacterium]|nr:response regulator [Lachnospiraceae bacterium]